MSTLQKDVKLSDKTVEERGLIQENPRTKDILSENGNFCSKKVEEKQFEGEVLGYVTPVGFLPICKIFLS